MGRGFEETLRVNEEEDEWYRKERQSMKTSKISLGKRIKKNHPDRFG